MALPWQKRAAESSSPLIGIEDLNMYQSVLEDLLKSLDLFEAEDAAHHETLSRLVRSISQACQSVPIPELLACLRDQDMDPSLRKWLGGCFGKIRRYSEVASILCHRARRIPMLRNVQVRIISDVVDLRGKFASDETIMDIRQSLARFQYKGETVQPEMLPEWLRRRLTQSSSNEYSRNVRNSLEEAKVHAEIQLLAYYENQQVKGIRPRILASSKKACALCNTVIAIHGVYRVPKSHGTLYRGWRLPGAHQNGALQDYMNAVLETSISEILERLIPLSEKPPIKLDNESSIFSFSLSASTPSDSSASTISEHLNAAATINGGDLVTEVAGNQSDQSHVENSALTEHAVTDGMRGENEDSVEEYDSARASRATDDQTNKHFPHDHILTDGSTTSLVRQPTDVRLRHGQPILFSPHEGSITCFRSRRIELLVDESSSQLSLELLSTAEAEAVLRDETKPVADVKTMASGIDVLLSKCDKGEVYISRGEEVIRICARLG